MLVDFGLSIDKKELAVFRGVYEALNQCVDRDSEEDIGSSRSASFGGTNGYMSPEQSSGDLGSLSEKTDIFSLGAVLFFLLTGKEYSEKLSEEENWRFVGNAKNPPTDLISICSKCVARKKEDRYQTAEPMQFVSSLGGPRVLLPTQDVPAGSASLATNQHPTRGCTHLHALLTTTVGSSSLGVHRS
jgi:hypothetical protein